MGLLDFLSTPQGQALASGIATYASTAKRGTPVNNIGRGLLGYTTSLADQGQEAEAKKLRDMQIQQMQMQMEKAKSDQASNAKWQQSIANSFKPTFAQAPFGQQQESMLAEQLGRLPDSDFKDASRMTEEAGSYAQMQTGMQFDKNAMMQGLPFAPPEIQGRYINDAIFPKTEEDYTLAPGAVRYRGGKQIASAPNLPKNETPSELRTVISLLGLPDDPASWNPQQRKQAEEQLVKIKQSGAASFSNYGSPVQGIGPEGKPVFFQPSPRGGPPSMVQGVSPMPKEEKGNVPSGFRLTKDGNLEAIPGGPADLKAQAMSQRMADGSNDVDVAITGLRDAYNRLEEGGGITSTSKGALSNMSAAASSSDIGQGFGKMLGTKNQSARNDISMARPALLAALMKATGMSAKQMDSNAELKLWLSTATDPTLDVESNRKALANIEKKYMSGNNQNYPSPNTQAINRLKMNKNNNAEIELFEQIFGPGSAKQYMR